MSRTMLVSNVSETEHDDALNTLFDVKRVDREPAPIAYFHTRTMEYVSAITLNSNAALISSAVDDGGFVPVFED